MGIKYLNYHKFYGFPCSFTRQPPPDQIPPLPPTPFSSKGAERRAGREGSKLPVVSTSLSREQADQLPNPFPDQATSAKPCRTLAYGGIATEAAPLPVVLHHHYQNMFDGVLCSLEKIVLPACQACVLPGAPVVLGQQLRAGSPTHLHACAVSEGLPHLSPHK